MNQNFPEYSEEEFRAFCRQRDAEQSAAVAKVARMLSAAMKYAVDFGPADFLLAMRLVIQAAIHQLQGEHFPIEDDADPVYRFVIKFGQCIKALEMTDVRRMQQELRAELFPTVLQPDDSNPDHAALRVMEEVLLALRLAVGELRFAGVRSVSVTIN